MIHGNFKGSPPPRKAILQGIINNTTVPSWSLIQGLIPRGGVAFGGLSPLRLRLAW